MFVRKKRNKSGTVSVQVIDKSEGYRVVKSFGSSDDPGEIGRMQELAKLFVEQRQGQYSLFPENHRDRAVIADFVSRLENASVRTVGPELIFGRLFEEIGFARIPEKLFRDIVVARLVYPSSKLKTIDYLRRYEGKTMSVQEVYRFLDRLNDHHAEQAKEIAYRHTQKLLKRIGVVFYDMTSLYFEAEDEDELRRIGFSKDGKFQNPQIMLGLLVGENGYPIGYDIFEGNTFEGKTLLPVLVEILKRYRFGKPVVVADAAMLSKDNLDALDAGKFPFIVAARLRNESEEMQKIILQRCCGLVDGQAVDIDHCGGRRLIVSYSDKRAKKDRHNRERGLRRLRQGIRSGRMTKEQLNNRGYNKFLKLTGKIEVAVDEGKVAEAQRWDGLKGYLTNTKQPAFEVIENYGHLWQIERAFRISKTDLRVRPMYHRRRRRIEAHVLVAFVAYTIYKELERRLKQTDTRISAGRAVELTQTMYEMNFRYPDDPADQRILLKMNAEQQTLYDLIYSKRSELRVSQC
ncbi:MAG: IS1634 family transposase [Verrucomicrobia bacterium]|jgi:transposase|nr:IS1634 family transposase [Verrucomicrobiota bacterium]